MRISGGSALAVAALLVALLACATVGTTASSACDGVSCGLGTCKELHPPIPTVSTYLCDCYPGWARLVPIVPSTPCYIPTCPSDPSCYTPTIKMPPLGSNLTLHPCLVMDCGPEGRCVEQQDKPLRCQCNPGATNMLNDPSLPCTKNCVIGKNGCPVKSSPPTPPPTQSLAPSSSTTSPDIGHESSGPAAPSSTQGNPSPTSSTSPGSVCLPNFLLPLLLLASLASHYIV